MTESPLPTNPEIVSESVADAYWQQKLCTDESAINLPFDLPAKPGDGFHFAKVERRLEAGIEPLMIAFAEEVNRSLAELWEALVLALLIGYGQETEQIAMGTSSDQPLTRPRCEDPIADLILGFVSATAVVQSTFDHRTSFRDLLEKPGLVSRSSPSRELLEEMAARDISKLRPAMSVVFGEYPASRISSAGCDLAFSWSAKSGLSLQYNTFRFSRGGANRIMGHLVTLAAWLSSDPDRPIVDVEFLTENERESLSEWNETERLSDFRGRTIHQLFEARYELRPATTALVDNQGNASYNKLNTRVNQIAVQLRSMGASAGQNIAISAERSLDLVASFLAIWKIGAAVVPIDGSKATDGVRGILEDLQPVVWIHDQTAPVVREFPAKRLSLEKLRPFSKRDSDSASAVSILPDATALVLRLSDDSYVKISHRALINRFAWFWRVYPFRIGQTACAHHSPASHHFIYELLVPLLEGIPVVLVDRKTVTHPENLIRILINNRVSRMFSDDAMLAPLIRAIQQEEALDLVNMRHWFVYGSPKTEGVLDFRKWIPDSTLIAYYGETETAGIASTFDTVEVGDSGAPVSFGKPMDNTRVEVRNSAGKLLPLGVWGRVWFGGISIAKAYSDSSKSDQSSIVEVKGERWFVAKTAGRWMPSGNLEFAELKQEKNKPVELLESPAVEEETASEKVSPAASDLSKKRAPGTGRRRIREDLDKEVGVIWGQILGGVPSDQTLRFSELGGDLDGLAAMVVAFTHQLKRKVSIKEVRSRETIAELRQFLKSYDDTLSNWSGLIPLREGGSKVPLVLIHDLGLGALGIYSRIAASVSPERPVFAVASRALSGFEEFGDVRSMARHYASEIQTQIGDGPVSIGGIGFGGRVAVEMARQLREGGREVPLVIPIEAQPRFASIGRRWFGGLSKREGIGANVPAKYKQVAGVWKKMKKLARIQYLLDEEHLDESYAGNVALLRLGASKSFFRAENSDLGWSKCISGGLRVVSLRGSDSLEVAAEAVGSKIEELL
mgnify:CR=1 FL=1